MWANIWKKEPSTKALRIMRVTCMTESKGEKMEDDLQFIPIY